ncbi:hypothetical protein Mal4_07550 [Maioricimonas rarisocia]|uniref:BON domain-containing protein n=1 Tax=Maioricimonas rarisocia TaxID=2528026 RepID=A0A517Z210_9PLAN|nr:BON domain-containing protein [Maioricimonas rarisocia]QDU36469.1 hypothetical protein Mal4_07550 [Maioricimonas rarisocia]
MRGRLHKRSLAISSSATLPMLSTALDDPVPSSASSDIYRDCPPAGDRREIERNVRNTLVDQPGLKFSSLVVRRIHDGVCLEGVLEVSDDTDGTDVSNLARQVAGVDNVINRLLVCDTGSRAVR